LSWHARIIGSRVLPKGATVSYGCEYTMPADGRIGILPVGYADGFRRLPKNVNTVLIEGKEYPIRGRVTMDQCMVDLGDLPDMTGAEAVLLGKQGDREISARDLGGRWEDNVHSIFASFNFRIPRRVVHGPLAPSAAKTHLPRAEKIVHHDSE
jgi:alanine racemase